ncbi:histidinol-phosphate transaminase [Candidatus Sumerlaeota bacterium]|nr:histidinol-phosphate transaminase [Candidatus Sumerlaeota bacterium]
MTMTRPGINPHLEQLEPYVPGEQPKGRKFIKLNTNEFPYPPSPRVIEMLRALPDDKARKYPDPVCGELRAAIGERFGFAPEQIIAGNGSDELLRMICHAFAQAGDTIGMLNPTYSLYPVLGAMYGLKSRGFAVDFDGRPQEELDLAGIAIFFFANPNPPYGSLYEPQFVAELVRKHPATLFVVDEAYVEFADWDCLALAREFENVMVTRTFSKSHSLAGMRVGFALGAEWLIDVLNRIRDSYNVNAASQAAALAAWQDREYYDERVLRVKQSRVRIRGELARLGWQVERSFGNFLFARCDNAPLVYEQLRERGILVRYFKQPPLDGGLRISIGSEEETDALLKACAEIAQE